MSNLWEDDVVPGATGRDCETSLICLCMCREKGISPDVIQLFKGERARGADKHGGQLASLGFQPDVAAAQPVVLG